MSSVGLNNENIVDNVDNYNDCVSINNNLKEWY